MRVTCVPPPTIGHAAVATKPTTPGTLTTSTSLAPGSALLTPVAGTSASVCAVVDSLSAGPAGLAVQVRVSVDSAHADGLDGQRVWVTAAADGQLVAFQAVARRAGATAIDLAGVSVPVQEHRRTSVRAETRLPASLRLAEAGDPAPRLSASTLDLSRASCRVQFDLADAASLPQDGDLVDVDIDVEGETTSGRSRVLRVDRRTGQAVLQFTRLDPEGAARIERHVLGLVAP